MTTANLTPAEQLYSGIQLTRPLLRNITSRVEADLAGSGVSVGQRAILEALLAVGQATAPEITKMLEVARQFVGRELKDLLERGFVEIVENPKHRTSKYYRLNSVSRKIIQDIRARETVQISKFASRFSKAEIAAFYMVQKALNDEFSDD